MRSQAPFDAVLLISFGGPGGLEDIRPFLANVLRGRRVPPARVEEVARHYEHFGGVSPLTAITMRQADGLRGALIARGLELPVFVGMRNWHPMLSDTMREMSQAGVRRAIGFISAAHRSYSSCTQYKQNVADARAAVRTGGHREVDVTYVGDWHQHEGFIDTNARHIAQAMKTLPANVRSRARLVFTAHSIPESMPGVGRYQLQLRASASAVAARVGCSDFSLVYQSRSGRPEDPWLGPDICEYLRDEHARGLEAVVLCPIGFVCDHIEVLYDLDYEASHVCQELGLPMARAEAVNDDPVFIDMMADVIHATWKRYERGTPLPFVFPEAPQAARPGADRPASAPTRP